MTRGQGTINHSFLKYVPYKGKVSMGERGAIVSGNEGKTTAYSLAGLESRGVLFVGANVPVYGGMVIGESSKEQDIEVNAVKGKKLTNMRASGKDDSVKLAPPRTMTLEELIAYMREDEVIEVTGKSLRLRKQILDPQQRKKHRRDTKNAARS
jgi:GTP-binding protein